MKPSLLSKKTYKTTFKSWVKQVGDDAAFCQIILISFYFQSKPQRALLQSAVLRRRVMGQAMFRGSWHHGAVCCLTSSPTTNHRRDEPSETSSLLLRLLTVCRISAVKFTKLSYSIPLDSTQNTSRRLVLRLVLKQIRTILTAPSMHETLMVRIELGWQQYWLIILQVAQRVEHWTCDQRVVGSKSYSGQSCVTTLGKLFTPMFTNQYNLVPAKGRWCSAAGKVTAGLAESNGSLPPGGWLIVTCGLTACRDQLWAQCSVPSMGSLYLF